MAADLQTPAGRLRRTLVPLVREVGSRLALRPAATPIEGTLAEAREGGYDLIVLGRHARERSRRDDITLRILAESGKPVLIVPPDE